MIGGAAFLVVLALVPGESWQQGFENLARGKEYQLDPPPNYRPCTDAADLSQLTDGRREERTIWTKKGAVGWSGRLPVMVTIDLKQVEPISGLTFSTASGVADVNLPSMIVAFVSDDGKRWYPAGELTAVGGDQSSLGLRNQLLQLTGLATQGRFVRIAVVPDGQYVFVDEIEVIKGERDASSKPRLVAVVDDVRAFIMRRKVQKSLRRRLGIDLTAVRKAIETANIDDGMKNKLRGDARAIAEKIPSEEISSLANFSTVFPMTELHREVFAIQAATWRAQGMGGVVASPSNRWRMLDPTETPVRRKFELDVVMMVNEHRGATVNLSNAGDIDVESSFVIEGLPGGTNPAYITLFEVPFTDTQSGVPVAAALLPVPMIGGRFVVNLMPGLTRQIWVSFHSKALSPGQHHGRLSITYKDNHGESIPLNLTVYPIAMPDQRTLHLSGWDDTDGAAAGGQDVTEANRESLIRVLREYSVDTPWARKSVLAIGKFSQDGSMIEPPDPKEFRRWLDRWPSARNYFVFLNAQERFAGFEMGSPAFKRALSEWITWWVERLGQWNIRPHQLGLLLVDEPGSAAQDRIIVEYAVVIRAVQPEVVIWEDPVWREPAKADPRIFELSGVLSPNLPMWIAGGPVFAAHYLNLRREGHRLWFYSCSGPGRLMDPYSYHRLQAWYCWKYGAEGSSFWSFSDSNGASSWNEYASNVGAYTPLFLDEKSVVLGKHMEAIREGMEDYEYLRILRERVERLERSGTSSAALAAARVLLDSAADRVLAFMTSPALMRWQEPKDRDLADKVRLEILGAIESLE